MERLIEEILTLSRQGRAISETETVALSAVVDDCWEVVDTGEAAVHVESDRSLAADADRLQQLLENLFRNAIEHAGPDVTIRVGSLEEGIGFYVADDGPGIPADDREAVFESGYSTARDGTGFGLAIVKEIADAHGWDVRATAGTDGGARFEVSGVEPAD
jgi:signal transduction histidine kinase